MSGQGVVQQIVRLHFRIEGKGLFDLPLGLGEVTVRLADTAMGAPGMLVVENNIAPRLVKLLGRVIRRMEHRPQRLGLHQAFGGVAIDRGLRRG